MSLDRFVLQHRPEHLCLTCKFYYKCPRHNKIVSILKKVESDAVEQWGMNLTTMFLIDECDLYKIDWNSLNDFIEAEEDGGDVYE